jgi:hypothetical protein
MTANWWSATRSRVRSMLRGHSGAAVSRPERDDNQPSAAAGDSHSLDNSAVEKMKAQWGRSS